MIFDKCSLAHIFEMSGVLFDLFQICRLEFNVIW